MRRLREKALDMRLLHTVEQLLFSSDPSYQTPVYDMHANVRKYILQKSVLSPLVRVISNDMRDFFLKPSNGGGPDFVEGIRTADGKIFGFDETNTPYSSDELDVDVRT